MLLYIYQLICDKIICIGIPIIISTDRQKAAHHIWEITILKILNLYTVHCLKGTRFTTTLLGFGKIG